MIKMSKDCGLLRYPIVDFLLILRLKEEDEFASVYNIMFIHLRNIKKDTVNIKQLCKIWHLK